MEASEIVEGNRYFDGKSEIRKVDVILAGMVVYTICAARKDFQMCTRTQQLQSVLERQRQCELSQFAAWADTCLDENSFVAYSNQFKAEKLKLTQLERKVLKLVASNADCSHALIEFMSNPRVKKPLNSLCEKQILNKHPDGQAVSVSEIGLALLLNQS